MYTCIDVCVYVYLCMCGYMYVHVYVRVCVCTHMCICMYVCVHTCACVCNCVAHIWQRTALKYTASIAKHETFRIHSAVTTFKFSYAKYPNNNYLYTIPVYMLAQHKINLHQWC